MKLILETSRLQDYLVEDEYVDLGHTAIRKKGNELFVSCYNEVDQVKKAYEFVRDEIAHSWDIQSTRITRTASETLIFKEGICYSKSILLAALLRLVRIPAGFCYQRITLGETQRKQK